MEMETIHQIFISTEVTERRVSTSSVIFSTNRNIADGWGHVNTEMSRTMSFLVYASCTGCRKSTFMRFTTQSVKKWLDLICFVSVQEENVGQFSHVSAFFFKLSWNYSLLKSGCILYSGSRYQTFPWCQILYYFWKTSFMITNVALIW